MYFKIDQKIEYEVSYLVFLCFDNVEKNSELLLLLLIFTDVGSQKNSAWHLSRVQPTGKKTLDLTTWSPLIHKVNVI